MVLENVLPAYETLLTAMRELRGTGGNHGGLANFPNGREYAQARMRIRTSSDLDVAQVDSLLSDSLQEISRSINSLVRSYPHLMDKLDDGTLAQIRYESPEGYLAILESAIKRDFPAMRPALYVVREVHESLQEFMSPAFFLIPAIDAYENNVIYINPMSESDNLRMFTMLAHEGFPGHLYQVVYYVQQSPHPLRTVIKHLGYDEGWATYAEFHSYSLAGLDVEEAMLMKYLRLYDLLFYCRLDLGVNAKGEGVDWVATQLNQFGIVDTRVINDFYQSLIGYPLHFLPYGLGYLELHLLLDEAVGALGSNFDIVEFHRYILDFGPAPFSLIQKHLPDWASAQPPKALTPAA
jgi:uncharacterized protein (DUF885 family)